MFRSLQDPKGDDLDGDFKRLSRICKKSKVSRVAKVMDVLWSKVIYEIWLQRCQKIYQGQHPSLKLSRKNIVFRATISCNFTFLGLERILLLNTKTLQPL